MKRLVHYAQGYERGISPLLAGILFILAVFTLLGPGAGIAGARADAGNGPASAEMLRIDGDVFTREELSYYIQQVLKADLPEERSPDYLRHVNSLILDWAGYPIVIKEDSDIETDPSVVSELKKLRSELLNTAYFKYFFVDAVPLTEQKVADSIAYDKKNYDLSIIVNQDREKILEAYRQVKGGMPFSQAVERYSDGFSRNKEGNIGLVEEGSEKQFTGPEFKIISNTVVGSCTIPFETRIGWMVVRVNRVIGPEEIRRERAKTIFPRKKIEMAQEAYNKNLEELRGTVEIEIDNSVLDAIYESATTRKPIPDAIRSTPVAKAGTIRILPAEISDLVLFHDRNDMIVRIRRAVDQELVLRDAVRRGLDGRENVRRLLEIQRRHVGVREYFKKKMREFAGAGEQEFRTFFESRKEDFRSDEQRELWVIEVETREEADAIRAALDDGADFADLASRRNRSEKGRENRGLVGLVGKKNLHPAIADTVFSIPGETVAGPLEVSPGKGKPVWVLLRVGRIQQGEIPQFENVDRNRLRDRYVLNNMTAFQREFLERIMKEHEVRTSRGGQT